MDSCLWLIKLFSNLYSSDLDVMFVENLFIYCGDVLNVTSSEKDLDRGGGGKDLW